jgi:hypothetical protein
MKWIGVVATFCLVFAVPATAQDNGSARFPSQYSITGSADVFPASSFYASGGMDLFTKRVDAYRGQARLALLRIFELGVMKEEAAVNFLSIAERVPMGEFKLRILERTENTPAISVVYRTSLGWMSRGFQNQEISAIRPADAADGLHGLRYQYRLTSAMLLISQDILPRFELTTGFGLEEVQTRFIWFFGGPDWPDSYGDYDPQTHAQLLLTGFLLARFDLTHQVTLFAEAGSVPVIVPSYFHRSLQPERTFLGAVGVRFVPLMPFALDAIVAQQSAFQGISDTQVRVALNTYLNFEAVH